jgi:hypothetical protein
MELTDLQALNGSDYAKLSKIKSLFMQKYVVQEYT